MEGSKSLEVRNVYGTGGLYEIYWTGGGEVPHSINGKYNDKNVALNDIKKYYVEQMVAEKASSDLARKKELIAARKEREEVKEETETAA